MRAEAGGKPHVKRPSWVLLISSFYISAGFWTVVIYYQMYSSGITTLLPESKLAYFGNYSGADYWPLMAVGGLNVLAGLLFLLLRKESVYVFAFKFVFAVGLAVWNALEKGSMDTSRVEYIVVGLLLWSSSAAVCFYAWHLMRKGVLR